MMAPNQFVEIKKQIRYFLKQIWNLESLNKDKTRFTLFDKLKYRGHLPLRLPVLKVNDYEIKWSSSIKSFRISIEGHLSWIDHINTLENKLSKHSGLMYKGKLFLNAKPMKSLYFSYFHSSLKIMEV